MSKTWMKKFIAVTMAVMLCTTTACGKKETKVKDTAKENTKDMVFQAADFDVEGIKGDISDIFIKNDKLYLNTYDWSEDEKTEDGAEEAVTEETSEESTEEAATEETSEESTEEAATEETSEESTEEAATEEISEESTEEADAEEESGEEVVSPEDFSVTQRMYCMNLDGTDVQEIKLVKPDETFGIEYMSVCSDGSFVFMMSSYDRKKETSSYMISKVDAQGNELLREDVTDLLALSDESWINKFIVDAKDRIIIVAGDVIYLVSDDLKSVDKIKPENMVEAVGVTKDGQVICGYTMWNEESSSTQVQILDVDNKKLGKATKVDISYFSSSDSIMDGNDYDFYYKDDKAIYAYDLAANKSVKLMDFIASNISSEDAWTIKPIAKDTFIGTTYAEDGTSRMVKYTKVDPSTIKDKKTITCGAIWIDDSVKKQIMEFNKNNPEYEIQVKDYSEQEGAMAKMNADIIAGNIPDIMILTELPYDQYISKGILEDLTPYFEKDEELNTSDIIDSVYQAMQRDGKLYYISPSFGVSTLVGKTSDVGTGNGWTFDEMKALLEEKGDGVRPFFAENKTEMLYSLLGVGVSDFVDPATGECSFNTQDFKDILEICNSGSSEEPNYDEEGPSMVSEIQDGKVLFYDGWIPLEQVQIFKKMFGEDVNYIGYPNEEKLGSYFSFDTMMSISSKSEVKEEAWKFVRSFMTKKFQATNEYIYNTPTRKDCLDMMIKRYTTTESYTDEFGREIEPLDWEMGWEELSINIKPLSDEEVKMYTDLVNNTKKVASYDEEIFNIIEEETKAYFAGDKSLDETVEIIQKRVQTYVNENR